jgi:hypothetical protein
MDKIREGKMSDRAARLISLAVKRKVINKGKEARNAKDIESKINLLSQQVSALAALTLTGISVGGDGLLSKAGIVSGLFTEEIEEELLHLSPKSETTSSIYTDSKEPKKNTDEDLMKLYVNTLNQLNC